MHNDNPFERLEVARQFAGLLERVNESRGDRAMLRRCRDPHEVLGTRMFAEYSRRLLGKEFPELINNPPEDHQLGMAAAIGLLGHVRRNRVVRFSYAVDFRSRFAAQLGKGPEDSRPRLSELRFRRLVACQDRITLYPQIIRAIHQLGDSVDLVSLAGALYDWRPGATGDPLRRRWSYAYYSTFTENYPTSFQEGSPGPAGNTTDSTENTE